MSAADPFALGGRQDDDPVLRLAAERDRFYAEAERLQDAADTLPEADPQHAVLHAQAEACDSRGWHVGQLMMATPATSIDGIYKQVETFGEAVAWSDIPTRRKRAMTSIILDGIRSLPRRSQGAPD